MMMMTMIAYQLHALQRLTGLREEVREEAHGGGHLLLEGGHGGLVLLALLALRLRVANRHDGTQQRLSTQTLRFRRQTIRIPYPRPHTDADSALQAADHTHP
eukprot:4790125-Pyramimonas_sp.AAC.1